MIFDYTFDTENGHIAIAQGSTYIPARAFRYRVDVKSVEIPDSVTSIGDDAFRDTQLTEVVISDSVTSIGDDAFNGSRLETVVIPNSITSIGDDVFRNNQLKEVVIPDSVITIGNGAFEQNRLQGVSLPDSLIYIGDDAFERNQLKEVVIPDSVIKIESDAFAENLLEKVTISSSAIAIDENAFSNNFLTEVVIPGSVTSIGESAFESNLLAEVIIPDSVTLIGEGAFRNNNLEKVFLPEKFVNDIPEDAFDPGVEFIFPDPGKNVIDSIFGKGKLRGTKNADQFNFDQFESFGVNTADKIIGFYSSQGDTIGVSAEAFPSLLGADQITFASASTKAELKQLKKGDYDLVYFEKNGRLFLNGNGEEKGWGNPDEGGLFAFLKGAPELTAEDFAL